MALFPGPYRHEAERTTYRNVRPARWVKKGEWQKNEGGPIVQKALTDITKYPEYVQELRELIGIEDTAIGNRTPLPLNIILYGPPGTGKTYTLRNKYMEQFTERAAALSREDFAADLVADLAWWQVITMVMLDLKTSNVSGILAHPLMEARIRRASNRTPRAAIWAHLQMHTKTDCPEVKYAKRYEPLLFSKDAESVWSIDEKLATEEAPDLVEALERYRGYTPDQGAVIKRYEFTTFHQSYSYEDFVEGIKPVMSEEVAETLAYEVKPGIFKTMVQRALADPNHDYALLIDEINRGNVANIFGELITLIEDDKRQGTPNELRARLPYSREEFAVPKNLYIIGAMNTADRSVEALDTALRRRFAFVAIPPQPEFIKQPANLDVDLRKLLGVINARIEKLLDKDHCIGHSYFMGIAASSDPLAELRNVFATKILPLMEEYFYGDPAKIGMVLGERFVSRKDEAIEWAEGDWGMDEFEERHVYTLQDPRTMKDGDFRAVYE
ncbi:MAG: AAA family ATPase [Candidatus Aureabacteria bacterium]|nr:AAA family ATPase [Candidatus Auribacterota bacterium]